MTRLLADVRLLLNLADRRQQDSMRVGSAGPGRAAPVLHHRPQPMRVTLSRRRAYDVQPAPPAPTTIRSGAVPAAAEVERVAVPDGRDLLRHQIDLVAHWFRLPGRADWHAVNREDV